MQPPGAHQSQRASRSFFDREIDRGIALVQSIDEYINTSTFGRIFRLKGSGHVGPHPANHPLGVHCLNVTFRRSRLTRFQQTA